MGKVERSSKFWSTGFAVVLIWLALNLTAEIDRPWINVADYNGAVWSQAAHNTLRAGLIETAGASAGFYWGPLPIPPPGYYVHHPPLLHLAIAALFAVFGEHEWVARLVPITSSLASAIFLWLLVRSCLGVRAATLSAGVFASLPMELHYGQMVNFEPCVLMLMLGALWCVRRWEVSRVIAWRNGALLFVVVGLWVDWSMYLFVITLCAWWLARGAAEKRRFAGFLLMASVVSALLCLWHIGSLRPDAWNDLSKTFFVRLGSGGGLQFTQEQWFRKIGWSFIRHFLPIVLMLAIAGAVILWLKRRDEAMRFLGFAALSVFVMDALFVGVFRNQSYIHEYAAFYFLVPISIAGGIALNSLAEFLEGSNGEWSRQFAAQGAVCLAVIALGAIGKDRAKDLDYQFHILNGAVPEQPNLIPELGKTIRTNFNRGAPVLCNFLPEWAPHLNYYAQRDILNNLIDHGLWQKYIDSHNPAGGVVWMNQGAAEEIVHKLPPGSKQFFRIGDISFCLWKAQHVPTD